MELIRKMRFIDCPNLPVNDVSLAVIGKKYVKAARELRERYGLECLHCGGSSGLPEPVKYHADMLVNYAGSGTVFVSRGEESLHRRLVDEGADVRYIYVEVGAPYPHDVPLNCAWIGEKLICGKYAAKEIFEFAVKNGRDTLVIRQGYARCSTCIVDENSVITSDVSIYRECLKKGMNALLIDQGHIELPGYDTGFIGGASTKINKNLLLFFGDLSCHPSQKEIRKFCYMRDVEVETLPGKLTDIGGIVPIMEKDSPIL